MNKKRIAGRSKARRFVLQALYQMQLTDCSSTEVEAQLIADHNMKRVDTVYLHELLAGISRDKTRLEEVLTPELDRGFSELDPVETAALFIGCFELLHRPDIPYKVAINEAVELTKQFGAAEGYKFINSVLDAVARGCRPDEVRQS